MVELPQKLFTSRHQEPVRPFTNPEIEADKKIANFIETAAKLSMTKNPW